MLVLDTHIWLWWLNNDRASLSPSRANMIDTSDQIGVSAISCFEVAWLAQHGRITLPCAINLWFEQALHGSNIQLIPITPQIAHCAASLAEHHRDPQDRLIIATALTHDAKLMSSDSKFALYQEIAGRLV